MEPVHKKWTQILDKKYSNCKILKLNFSVNIEDFKKIPKVVLTTY